MKSAELVGVADHEVLRAFGVGGNLGLAMALGCGTTASQPQLVEITMSTISCRGSILVMS